MKDNRESVVQRIAPSLLIESSSNLQVSRTAVKSWIRARSDYSLGSYSPMSAKKHCIWLCLEHSLLILIGSLWDLQIMWTGINLGRVPIPARLEYWLWSYLPHIPSCPEQSLLRFNQNFMKLADTWTGIKSQMNSNSGQIRLFTWELLAHKYWLTSYLTLSGA